MSARRYAYSLRNATSNFFATILLFTVCFSAGAVEQEGSQTEGAVAEEGRVVEIQQRTDLVELEIKGLRTDLGELRKEESENRKANDTAFEQLERAYVRSTDSVSNYIGTLSLLLAILAVIASVGGSALYLVLRQKLLEKTTDDFQEMLVDAEKRIENKLQDHTKNQMTKITMGMCFLLSTAYWEQYKTAKEKEPNEASRDLASAIHFARYAKTGAVRLGTETPENEVSNFRADANLSFYLAEHRELVDKTEALKLARGPYVTGIRRKERELYRGSWYHWADSYASVLYKYGVKEQDQVAIEKAQKIATDLYQDESLPFEWREKRKEIYKLTLPEAGQG